MKRSISILALAIAAFLAASCGSKAPEAGLVDYDMSYSVGDASFDMIKVPAGNFTMWLSADNRSKVTNGTPMAAVMDGFVISDKPVSQALWTAVMGSNPSSAQDPSAPVDKVSWNDAQKFISKLSKMTGKPFFLPTEAQWEYAAKFKSGAGFSAVSEWCQDAYDQIPEGQSSDDCFNTMTLMVNPCGPAKGDKKVVRNISERVGIDSHSSKAGVGFRVAQSTEETIPEEMMEALDGTRVDRETVDASDSKAETFTVGNVTFSMIKVKGGEFTMGCSPSDTPFPNYKIPDNEKVTCQVTLSDYEMGETEVTVALWNAVMGSVPYLNDIAESQKPVGNVSWYDCQAFIRRLNAMTGRKFRLPTEAEWEYAARGGAASRHYGFSGSNDMLSVMWFVDNAEMKPKAVKTRKANELGLYDMSGNVWEWCYDRGEDAPYPADPHTDPTGAAEGFSRVIRSGSAASRWEACRVTNRSFMPAKNIKGTFGLRLAI